MSADGLIARGLLGSGAMEPSLITALVVMLLAMAICAALGVIIERFAYRPVRKYSRLTALITAIGVSLLLENGGQVVFGADPKFFPELFKKRNIDLFGGASINSADIIVLVIALALMIGLQLVVFRTKTGRAMRAVSFNLQSAKLMGINTDRIIMFTFALGSALAAAAGVLVAIRIPRIDPLMGILVGLKAFVAAVLGGIGNIPGAMLGRLADRHYRNHGGRLPVADLQRRGRVCHIDSDTPFPTLRSSRFGGAGKGLTEQRISSQKSAQNQESEVRRKASVA